MGEVTGPRVHLQCVLPYLLLEEDRLRPHELRTRSRDHGSARYVFICPGKFYN